jgi:hypothetical protein
MPHRIRSRFDGGGRPFGPRHELRKERLVVFAKLRRLGVQCLEAPCNRVGTDLINRYLAIKQGEII